MQVSTELIFGLIAAMGVIFTLSVNMGRNVRQEGSEHGAIESRLKSISDAVSKIDKDIERMHRESLESIKAIARLEERVRAQDKDIKDLKHSINRLEPCGLRKGENDAEDKS